MFELHSNCYGVIHIITKGRGFRNNYANVIFALSNAEFDYRRGRGLKQTKSDYVICERPLMHLASA